jgi:hypothetical protein
VNGAATIRACRGALLALLIALRVMDGAGAAAGQSGSFGEYEVKSAMLYHLTKFVEWPGPKGGDGASPFQVCVFDSDPFGRELDKALAGKAVGAHPVTVRRLGGDPSAEGCHVLLVARADWRRFRDLIPALAKAGVLTVADGEHLAGSGAVIGLAMRDERVQLEINMTAAQRSGLTISSKLLRIADVVKEGGAR